MAERRLTGLAKASKRYAVLGQLRPANTTAASLYSPAANIVGFITRIIVCNTPVGAGTYRLFIDNDGTTYDETTALAFDISLAANTTTIYDFGEMGLPMSDDSGNFAVRTGTNDALNFTAWGYELIGNG